jgi:hypothetical protein
MNHTLRASGATKYAFFDAVDYTRPHMHAGTMPLLNISSGQHTFVNVLRPIANLSLPTRGDWRNDIAYWPPNRSTVAAAFSRTNADDAVAPASTFLHPVSPRRATGLAGCYHSHLEVFLDAQRAGHEAFLVLEDDVGWDGRFPTALFDAVAHLPACWDLLHLGWHRSYRPCSEGMPRACEDLSYSQEAQAHAGICRTRNRLQNTGAIAYHRRALDWLIPMLSEPWKAHRGPRSEGPRSELLLPFDLTLQAHLHWHPEIHAYANYGGAPLFSQYSFSNVYTLPSYKRKAIGSDIGHTHNLMSTAALRKHGQLERTANENASRVALAG